MKANFNTIINSDTPVLIDFSAEWCGPCKIQAPILQELSIDMGEKVRIIKIDVDKNQEIAMRYKIQSVPTLMIFKNGETKFRHSGVLNKEQLVTLINQNL